MNVHEAALFGMWNILNNLEYQVSPHGEINIETVKLHKLKLLKEICQ